MLWKPERFRGWKGDANSCRSHGDPEAKPTDSCPVCLGPRLGVTRRRHTRLPVCKSQSPGTSSTVQTVMNLGLLIITTCFSGEETCGWTLIQQQCWLDCNWRQEKEWKKKKPISLELKVLNFFDFFILQFCSF